MHDSGDHGFVPGLIDIARRTRVAGFVADGANRWPAVHRRDAARLYGVAEEGVMLRTIAQAIGEGLGVPVRSIAEEEARAHFDWMARFVAIDNPASSAITRATLRWRPQEVDLLGDMREGGYFT